MAAECQKQVLATLLDAEEWTHGMTPLHLAIALGQVGGGCKHCCV